MKMLLFCSAALLACTGAAAAATIADLEARDLWAGEDWKVEDLRDHVVVVEYWGYN